MMLKCAVAIFFLGSITLPAVRVDADACDCAVKPVCHAFWTADAVFVGRAERVVVAPHRHLETHLVIERWLRGSKVGLSIVIDTRGANISCDAYAFTEGQQYIVYAVKGPTGEWRAPLCGGTRPLESAAADLEYALNVARRPGPSVVSGFVAVDMRTQPHALTGPPMIGAQLTLSSPRQSYVTMSGPHGEYRFDRVTAGDYILSVAPFAGADAVATHRLLVGPNACIQHVFWTAPP